MTLIHSSVELLLGTPGCGRSALHSSWLHNLKLKIDNYGFGGWPTEANVRRHVIKRGLRTTADRPQLQREDDLRRLQSRSGAQSGPLYAGDPRLPRTLGHYNAALESLLRALRQDNTLKLYFALLKLVRSGDDDNWAFVEAVAAIPATTFSEILRSLDPYKVSGEVDSAPGINISYGAAVHTPLGELVNKWGVKILYVKIFNRLRRMQDARRRKGIRPLLNDYVALMKCAGATSDIRAVKELWHSIIPDGYADWRHTELYVEFIKARFLTEKLYANNDLARFCLRPTNLHRSGHHLRPSPHQKLTRLQENIIGHQKHRFGQNIHERYFAEPLIRILRKRKPLHKIERRVTLRGLIPGSKRLVCALMKANGRSGRMQDNKALLQTCWGINIQVSKETREVHVGGGYSFPPDSPSAPTELLLDAVLHSFCCMGETALASKLVDFISRRFNIPIPDNIWSDLIQYTRILHTSPAATQWKIAGFPQKAAKAASVLDIWEASTQEPYNFKPDVKDYFTLLKSLITSSAMRRPLEALRQVRPLYDDIVRDYEEAWCELIQTTQQGVSNHAAYRRYRLLQSKKDHAWFCLHDFVLQILKNTRSNRVDDNVSVRGIPDLIRDFGQFMPLKIDYDIATGRVEFASDNARSRRVVETQQTVEKPEPIGDRLSYWDELEELEDLGEEKEENEIRDDVGYGQMAVSEGQERGITPQTGEGTEIGQREEIEGVEDGVEDERRLDPEIHSGDGLHAHNEPASETADRLNVTSRYILESQLVDNPAYRYRPRWSGHPSQRSILATRREGREFTGYHDDLVKAHFAAHRVIRATNRTAGTPVVLRRQEGRKMMEQLLRVKT